MKPCERTFVALDNLDSNQVMALLPQLKGKVLGIKIGLEMYLRYGREFVLKAKDQFQGQIFLDLKLHDIPNTVSKAIASLEGLPINFLTIHASGGSDMIKAACESAKQVLPNTKILAVTVLTSLDDADCEQIYGDNRAHSFHRLLALLKNNDAGVVCSGAELELISKRELTTMVPGIRFEHEIQAGKTQDQKSVYTPKQALERGASYLVMGRSITAATNPAEALAKLQ